MKIVQVAQRSESWFAARRGIPTASRFDAILTPKTGKPAAAQETLINALIAESIEPPDSGFIRPQFVSEEMEQGMKLEGEGRCSFELEFAQAPVTEVGFVLHESGLFGASPDGLVGDVSGVELKCPKAETLVGYIRAGVLPDAYKAQVHGSMVVTGRDSWSFFAYARHFAPFHILVKRDDFTAALEKELFSFCERYGQVRQQFGLPPIGNK
jgi:hypothetical protein